MKNITAIRTIENGKPTLTVTIPGNDTWTTSGKRAASAAAVIVVGNCVHSDGSTPDDLDGQPNRLGVAGTRSDLARAQADAATMAKPNKYDRMYENVSVVKVTEPKAKPAKTPKAKTPKASAPTTENKSGAAVAGRERGTGSIFQRTNGRFVAARRIDGARQRKVFSTLDDANAWLDSLAA